MRILSQDTMLLVIDYQEKLLPVIHNNNELINNTKTLITGIKTLNLPIIFTQQYTQGIGMTVNEIKEIAEGNFQYYDKTSFSCADDENILSTIEKTNKKNIIVCGIEAHICVLQTIIDLTIKGYNIILIEDCIGSRKINDKKYAIKRASQEGAIISTYESILFELTRNSKHESFRLISKLIK